MSTKAFFDTEFQATSSQSQHTVRKSASCVTDDDDIETWKRETSLSKTTDFASLFYLLNDFEFNDSNQVAVALAQAKESGNKIDEERSKCFIAIQFLFKKKRCIEFLNTCCSILDKLTKFKSDSLGDYLRHARWEKLSSIRPLEAFQETVVIDLIDSFGILIQNRRTVLQDWESRTLCRFLVHFYKCMLLFMYLLKEQEKILRAKHLKLVLDKRRQGLKVALETSIAPLFDTNFEASGTHEVVLGGQEFMTCIKSEERALALLNEHTGKKLACCFFSIWSRRTSFKLFSINVIVHALMKFLQDHCRRWANYVSKSKTSKTLHRVCRGHINKKQQILRTAVFQKWMQLTKVSKKFTKIISQKICNFFKNWSRITVVQKRLISGRNLLYWHTFKCWRAFTVSKISKSKLTLKWLADVTEKKCLSTLKTTFQAWKRWYLARWIAKSYVDRSCKTRALNAWIEYQICFLKKMITCASRVKFLIDSNCVVAHFLKWKMRTDSKQNVQLTVIIQKLRIRLRIWNRKCGFGIFKTGQIMTACAFCFNRWKKVSKDCLLNRRTIGHILELAQKKMRYNTHFGAWNDVIIQRNSLKEKVPASSL
jgi:hypothetical protein